MSETFDPNAWPYPQGGRPQQGSRTAPRDDDYDDLTYDEADFDAFDDDDDDDEIAPPAPGAGKVREEPSARTRRPSNQDDYDDDEDDYDDDYDDYDDGFDRDLPGEGGGTGRKVVGILAALALVAAFVIGGVMVFGGGGGGSDTAEEPTTVPADQTPAAPAAGAAPTEVAETLARALSAWGAFAVNGDLNLVNPYFVAGTKQYASLEKDSGTLKSRPPGGDPWSYTMTESTSTATPNGDWIIKGVVLASRAGEQTSRYPWEIRMTRAAEGQPWQILTIREY